METVLKFDKIINSKEETNMFQINHDESFSGSTLMPEGEYEIIIKSANEDATKSGTVYINIPLIVRNDVEQPYKNKYIFYSIWKNKQTGEYNPKAFNTIAKAIGIENGRKFANLEEMLESFKGKTARITLKHEEYNGKTSERVSFWNPTKTAICAHQFKEKTLQEETHDDLPF